MLALLSTLEAKGVCGKEHGVKLLTFFGIVPLVMLTASLAAAAEDYFGIQVVDAETGRGVPMIELRTVHHVPYWTDSGGWVAFHEPGLMGHHVFFFVEGDGYIFPHESMGSRGFTVRVTPGGRHRVEVQRKNVAERLYRLTGGGVYRDTVLLGQEPPRREPLLNARVLGQDSTMALEYRGRTWWFWGDTLHPAHPLGNFDMTVATSLTGAELEPERAIDYDYFESESGFTKRMAPVPGEGPTWLSGFAVIKHEGEDRLVAGYAKIRNYLETYGRGIVLYDDAEELFEPVAAFSMERPLHPIGHAIELETEGQRHLYFQNPLPLVRAEPRLESLADSATYEAFTPLVSGSRREENRVERDERGEGVWGWKRDTPEMGPDHQPALVEAGALLAEERLFAVHDWRTGKEINLHAGAVQWNEYRQRWVLIVSEIMGDSTLGEVWFAEGDSPLGPWVYGQRIVSHKQYTFYNPRHHAFLDRDGGRLIYFEGTYTEQFSGVERATPRYDYNQILYRLDLADPRLDLPVAVYQAAEGCLATATMGREVSGRPAFWAWERAGEGRVGVRCAGDDGGSCELVSADGGEALFYVLAPEAAEALPHARALEGIEGIRGRVAGSVLPHPLTRGPVLTPARGEDLLP